jgi:hypothetical protein
MKNRSVHTDFTFCLPVSPKVNAGGACGAWLPGREWFAAFRFDEGERSLLLQHPTGETGRPLVFAGLKFLRWPGSSYRNVKSKR